MAWYRRTETVTIVAAIIAVIILFNFYRPGTVVKQASDTLIDWALIISTTMVWVGLINVVRGSTRQIRRREPGRWYVAGIQLILIAVMLIAGFAEGPRSTVTGPIVRWLYDNYYMWGSFAASAISGLWIMAATFRALRIKTLESFIFVFGAVFVLLEQAPVGGAIWAGFPIVGGWIMDNPYGALQRAFTIGTGIGIMAYALRFYIGRERGAYGIVEE